MCGTRGPHPSTRTFDRQKRCRWTLHMADIPHVGGKPNRSGTIKVTAREQRSRPGTDARLAGQGPGKALLAFTIRSMRRRLERCYFNRWPARNARTAELNAAMRSTASDRPRARRTARKGRRPPEGGRFLLASYHTEQQLRAVSECPLAEEELSRRRLDQRREFADLPVKQFAT